MSCQTPKYYLTFVLMKIGHKIKELRLKGGYSQKDLSIKSGLSERTIQRIEKDEVTPNPHTLKVLGEIFEENFHQFENENQPYIDFQPSEDICIVTTNAQFFSKWT